METEKYLIYYYNIKDEHYRLSSRYGMIEYITTMKYIEKYLKKGMRILEIGAGTGRYSHSLAQQGYMVDAIELVKKTYKNSKKTRFQMKVFLFFKEMLLIYRYSKAINTI